MTRRRRFLLVGLLQMGVLGLSAAPTLVETWAAEAPEPWSLTGYQHEDMGTLGGPRSVATALNEQGDGVGVSETAGGALRAFIKEHNAKMQELGVPGADRSGAVAINAFQQVLGYAHIALDGKIHVVLW